MHGGITLKDPYKITSESWNGSKNLESSKISSIIWKSVILYFIKFIFKFINTKL
jgi:hypothetical protein